MALQVDPIMGAERYLDAVVSGDTRLAREIVTDLVTEGAQPRSIYLEVLAPALVAIGELWQVGRVTVAQEHLATAITQAQLAWLAPRMVGAPRTGKVALLTATPGELHVVGLRMVADFLTSDGWDVLDLGASTPTDDLVALVADRRPSVVGLSTALTTHLISTRATIARVHALPAPPLVIVGGAAYAGDEALAASLGADLFAPDAGRASAALMSRLA